MAEWIQRLIAKPWIAHLIRAVGRFGERMGGQFAAAITYFSVLSIIPVLMVAFAALGLTIAILVPDVLDQVKAGISDAVSARGGLGQQLNAVVDQAFGSAQAVGIVGLVSAVWSGATWVNHTRLAVLAMMRAELDVIEDQTNAVVRTVRNLGILAGLFLLVGASLAMTTAATSARGLVAGWLGLASGSGAQLLLGLLPLLGTLLAGWVLFLFLFTVFPEQAVPARVRAIGAAIGGVGMTALQYLAGTLVGVFSGNVAAAIFGGVIITMLYFNLFATLILLVAAWIATHPSAPDPESEPDLPIADRPTDYATKQLAAELAELRARADQVQVPQHVAVRATRVGMSLGAVFGGALAGLAAVIAAALSGLRGR